MPKRVDGAGGDIEVARFTYLGYELAVVDTTVPPKEKMHHFRSIKIDMAPKKVAKYERKIHRAFLAFAKDGNFELLRQRLVFLASNRNYSRKSSKKKFPVGIYYNFSEITQPSLSLKKIDRTLRAIVIGKRKRIANSALPNFSKLQQDSLLNISFEHGHLARPFRRYSPDTLKKITSIWQE
ncbi:MAG: hypothetical protein DHS20C12_05460 [Pseudohongiella sp.]|nr:MAG: hypothetical protein DHS20C12_05460 [Pseudohongiella sp.]